MDIITAQILNLAQIDGIHALIAFLSLLAFLAFLDRKEKKNKQNNTKDGNNPAYDNVKKEISKKIDHSPKQRLVAILKKIF